MSGDFGFDEAVPTIQKHTNMGTGHFKYDSFRILSCLQVQPDASGVRVSCFVLNVTGQVTFSFCFRRKCLIMVFLVINCVPLIHWPNVSCCVQGYAKQLTWVINIEYVNCYLGKGGNKLRYAVSLAFKRFDFCFDVIHTSRALPAK